MAHLKLTMESETLRLPVSLDILMPQGRGGYKTLYLLHGAGGDCESWLLRSRVADYCMNTNIAVVCPSGDNRFYVNNVNGRDYGNYIADELVNFMEKTFSVSDRMEDRYIGGMSMGAYGAFYAALNRPNQYRAAFSYSGLLDISKREQDPQGLDLFPVFGEELEREDNEFDILKVIHKSGYLVDNKTNFYISCGLSDERIGMSRDCYKVMKDAGFKVSYKESEGKHDFDYWDSCIKDTIELIKED